LTVFIAGQGALQALNVVTGLFLVRKLDIEAFAQYSLAIAFQNTAISLTSLGLTDSIIPLVGAHSDNRMLVGKYVQAARHLRTRLFIIVAPCCAIAFLLVVHGQHWDIASQLILLVSILASLYLSVSVSCWSSPLLLKRRLYDYYFVQAVPGLARLATYITASLVSALSASLAALTGAASILLNGLLAKKRSADLVEMPTHVDTSASKEVLRCMLPMMPAAIFTSFQPQVALLLVSIFGQTIQIAQIAALGRISQVFLIFSAFGSVVVEPYIARVPSDRLLIAYTRIIVCAVCVGALLTLLSFEFPSALLWVLGSQYRDLDHVVGWVVLSSSLSTIANVIWVMNRGRRWLFWRGSLLEIGCLILFQTTYVVAFGVRTTYSAALFMLAASCAHLTAHTYIMVYGFSRHRYPSSR
jgi:O-antigen/teichoic acid export membrane protein